VKLIQDSGFKVSVVNLNVKLDSKWGRESFTAKDPKIRTSAVNDMKKCMDLASTLNSNMVTYCPLADGHDCNFQMDYVEHWHCLVEGILEAAKYRNDIKITLEYKPNETRKYVILPDIGTTFIYAIRLVFLM